MAGPKASWVPGNRRMTARAMMWARAVAQHVEGFGVLVGEDLERRARPVGGQLAVEVDDRRR